MRTVTAGFKTAIKTNGRQINSIITYGATTLGQEDLVSVNLTFNGDILKSVMRGVKIEANSVIAPNTDLNVKCGVFVGEAYEYIDYGDFKVYKAEYNADTLSWVMTCYDNMLKSMIPYDLYATYPITVVDYLSTICLQLGLKFASAGDTFNNYDVEIATDVHSNINYTYRDVLDELAQITGSTICINDAGELEVRYITESSVTIDETYLKSINVTVKEKYGPINSIVFSRSEESDNIVKQDEASVEANRLCEIKIQDNQLLNGEDRSNFIDGVYDALNGTEYYIYDFDSAGIMFLDLCDRYTISIGGTTYTTVMLNDSIVMDQGLTENLFVEMPEETTTQYQFATDSDKKLNKAMLIVDKQLLTITSSVSTANGDIAVLEQTVGGFQATVEQVTENTDNISTLTQTVNNFTLAFTQKGYSNLIADSILNFGGTESDTFDKVGTWGSYQNSEISNNTVSNYLARCTALDTGIGKLTWIVRTIPNTAYSLAIKYNNTNTQTSSCEINNNGIIVELFNTNEAQVYQSESVGFVATGSTITITIETDGTGFSYSDLMLNYGVLDIATLAPNSIVWQSAVGEVSGTNIKMSNDGIEIFMLKDESGTYTLKHVMDASGSRIVDSNDNIITSFDVEGMTTVKATITSQINLGNFSFLVIDSENCIEY